MPFLALFTGICHLAHVLTVPPAKVCLLCTTPTGLDLYIQAMPVGTYWVQSPGFPKIVYCTHQPCHQYLNGVMVHHHELGSHAQKLGCCFLYCAGAARVWRGWRHYTIGLFEHTTASSAFYVQLATTLEKVKIHLQIQCWMFRSCTLLLCVSVRTRADVRKLKVYL